MVEVVDTTGTLLVDLDGASLAKMNVGEAVSNNQYRLQAHPFIQVAVLRASIGVDKLVTTGKHTIRIRTVFPESLSGNLHFNNCLKGSFLPTLGYCDRATSPCR